MIIRTCALVMLLFAASCTGGESALISTEISPSSGKTEAGASTSEKSGSSAGCIRAGCSGQLCVDAASEPFASTCEWKEEYACAQLMDCGRNEKGDCGLSATPESEACFKKIQKDDQ